MLSPSNLEKFNGQMLSPQLSAKVPESGDLNSEETLIEKRNRLYALNREKVLPGSACCKSALFSKKNFAPIENLNNALI